MGKKFLPIIIISIILSFSTTGQGDVDYERVYSLARMEFARGNLETSSLFLRYALAEDPSKAEPYLELAGIYRIMGEKEKALETLSKGIEFVSDNNRLKVELARLLLDKQRGDQVIQLLKTAERDRDTYFYLGLAYFQVEEWARARKSFQIAIEEDPRMPSAHYFLGLCEKMLGNLQTAIFHLERAISLERSFTGVYPVLGDLYYEKGLLQKALNSYNQTPAQLRDSKINERISYLREVLTVPVPPPDEREPVDRTVSFRQVIPLDHEDIPVIRVALMTTAREVRIQAGSDFIVKLEDTGDKVFKGDEKTTYIISMEGNNILIEDFFGNPLVRLKEKFRIDMVDPSTTLNFFDMEYGQGYFWAGREDRQYRGSFIVQPREDGQFVFINEVNLEEYLYSVIPSEMPASWPLEALKAQAIAARSYTMTRYARDPNRDYHLVASVLNAAYKGVTWENSRSTQAVDETRGVVAKYNGNIIDAVYSSNSGGHTEDAAHVWVGGAPYLQGVNLSKEANEFPLTPYRLDTWVRNWEEAYSFSAYGTASNYRWNRVLLPYEPRVANTVGRILDIIPLERGTGGSVVELKVVGEKSSTVIKGDAIRGQLGGLKSNRFIVEPVYFSNSKSPDYFVLWGGGWGHGVGLDQTGAAGMANSGYNYQEILKFFYQGIYLERIY